MFIGDSLLDKPCTICGELARQAQLFYAGGIVVRVPAARDALWKQEQMDPIASTMTVLCPSPPKSSTASISPIAAAVP